MKKDFMLAGISYIVTLEPFHGGLMVRGQTMELGKQL
jgi:hypothetical protein